LLRFGGPAEAVQPKREVVESSKVTLKPGTVLVFGDNDVSPVRFSPLHVFFPYLL
jgi:hypothetical protein